MKKFAVGIVFLAAFVSFAVAQTETKNVTVKLEISKSLTVSGVTDLNLGTIYPGSSATKSGDITIKTNYKFWTVKAYATYGVLTQYVDNAYVTTAGATTIPYKFSFNSAASTSTEKFTNQTLSTAPTSATTATFTSRTSGSNGQTFSYQVDITAADTANADAANYQDVISLIVTVN